LLGIFFLLIEKGVAMRGLVVLLITVVLLFGGGVMASVLGLAAPLSVSQASSQAMRETPLLVNAATPLPAGHATPMLVEVYPDCPVGAVDIMVAAEVKEPLMALFSDLRRQGFGGAYVNSGWRSSEEQALLYNASVDKSYVQRPGASEHETGLAVDIASSDGGTGDVALYDWLADNAWRYGFIVRYPADKVGLTGIAYEPWHVRYVGVDVARVCFEQGLCLEEYVAG
jgi:LAS superfamily LD-carboxypeptidase LdcB